MNTKLLLAASALFMGALGIAGTFLPEELLRTAGVAPSRMLIILAQLHAAVLFGFAMVNWMARRSLIGGIYNRPVAVGNVAHFVVGALALLKAAMAGGQVVALYALTGFYTLFAVGFAFVLFRSPVSNSGTGLPLASLLLVTIAVSFRVAGQESPISADRPGFADGPSVLDAGRVQIETGLSLSRSDTTQSTIPTLVRFGVTQSLELRLESDVVRFSGGSRDVAPVAAGMKLRLRTGAVPLSLLAKVQPPSGEGNLRTTALEGEVRLLSALDLGNGFSIVPNVGAVLAESEPIEVVIAGSLEKELGEAVPFVDVELHGNDGNEAAIVDGGVAWIPQRDTQFDIAGGYRISGRDYDRWFVAAGVSRRF